MEIGELKPLITALVLPPALPLLLAAWGSARAARGRKAGVALVAVGISTLWLLSCNAVAVWLAHSLLPQAMALSPAQLAATLQARQTQAVVVLGGGLLGESAEYGTAQPTAEAAARLRYGAWLVRQTGLPLAFSGGLGWANHGVAGPTEGDAARDFLRQDYGLPLRWLDDQSRDTMEGALKMKPLMARDGIRRIALVTSAWHMPRAVQAFERAGFDVLAAPMSFTVAQQRPWLEWLPSGHGLVASQRVLREWIGLRVAGRY